MRGRGCRTRQTCAPAVMPALGTSTESSASRASGKRPGVWSWALRIAQGLVKARRDPASESEERSRCSAGPVLEEAGAGRGVLGGWVGGTVGGGWGAVGVGGGGTLDRHGGRI